MSAFATDLLTLGAALVASAAPAPAPQPLPDVVFVYPGPHGTIFDRVCEGWIKQKVNPADVQELLSRKAEFEAEWDKIGKRYMQLALDATGRPYPYRQIQATLSVCAPDSMAFPLLIRMNDFMASNTEYYVHDFALLAFHELMHHHAQAIEGKSKIFVKYADLPFSIRAHIHVVAFERYVLEKTGRTEQLAKLKAYYAAGKTDHYRRAWEIVDTEGVEAVIVDARGEP